MNSETSIVVRPARPEQWPEVIAFYRRENDPEEVKEAEEDAPKNFAEIPAGQRLIWFAWAGNTVVGIIHLSLIHAEPDLADGKTVALVRHLKVAKGWEGKGISTLLHQAAVAEAKRRGLKQTAIECQKNNTHAYEIYQHWGYKVVRDGKDGADWVLHRAL